MSVLCAVGMVHYTEETTLGNRGENFLERNATLRFKRKTFLGAPSDGLHTRNNTTVCLMCSRRITPQFTGRQQEAKPAVDAPVQLKVGRRLIQTDSAAPRNGPFRIPSAVHRITSSAISKTDCGIVSPMAWAVLRLTTNSNLVGCSMGKSPGFMPLRILSTYPAERRNKSA